MPPSYVRRELLRTPLSRSAHSGHSRKFSVDVWVWEVHPRPTSCAPPAPLATPPSHALRRSGSASQASTGPGHPTGCHGAPAFILLVLLAALFPLKLTTSYNAAFSLRPSALRGTVGNASMTTSGVAGTSP